MTSVAPAPAAGPSGQPSPGSVILDIPANSEEQPAGLREIMTKIKHARKIRSSRIRSAARTQATLFQLFGEEYEVSPDEEDGDKPSGSEAGTKRAQSDQENEEGKGEYWFIRWAMAVAD